MISKPAVTQKLREIMDDLRQLQERVQEVASYLGADVLDAVLADDPDHGPDLARRAPAYPDLTPDADSPHRVLDFKRGLPAQQGD
jgi:hypothetical protein